MKVYKYRGIEKDVFARDLKTFQNNQFFAPKFEVLNDPFEANFKEIISNTLDIVNNIFSIDAQKLKDQLKEVVDYKHKLGILSLSKTCLSEQMWAYYASSNKGYCIEYDLEKLKDKTQNFDFLSQLDIKYSNEIPTIGFEDLKNSQMISKMFGVKKENWRHEKEIRLIFNNSSLKSHHESAITGVCFGCHATEDNIEIFKDAFENRNIKFYKISVNKEKNRLESHCFYESIKEVKCNIDKFKFNILKHNDNTVVENYYIYLEDTPSENDLNEFASAFREKYCYKPSNLNIFNTPDVVDLIDIYPLEGKDYIRYADAFIALADFSSEDHIWNYPFKDFYYKELIKKNE